MAWECPGMVAHVPLVSWIPLPPSPPLYLVGKASEGELSQVLVGTCVHLSYAHSMACKIHSGSSLEMMFSGLCKQQLLLMNNYIL